MSRSGSAAAAAAVDALVALEALEGTAFANKLNDFEQRFRDDVVEGSAVLEDRAVLSALKRTKVLDRAIDLLNESYCVVSVQQTSQSKEAQILAMVLDTLWRLCEYEPVCALCTNWRILDIVMHVMLRTSNEVSVESCNSAAGCLLRLVHRTQATTIIAGNKELESLACFEASVASASTHRSGRVVAGSPSRATSPYTTTTSAGLSRRAPSALEAPLAPKFCGESLA
ncbi:hypothetical protein M885DRAFT_217091 [Pelagophyceae sp. CCMP2097]|nr:hypothetical protein M885DRAFT_217091 [Pelagophyceae sp. CCMP2097]